MLDQFSSVVDLLLRFFPRLDVVSTKEAGIAWVRGKPKEIRPGSIFCYWPLWTEVEYIDLFPNPVDLPTQALRIGDREVAVSALVEWRVSSARLALSRKDVVEKIRCQGMAAVRNALFGSTLKQLAQNEAETEERMRRDLQQAMRGYGVQIEQVYFSDITTCRAFLHLGAGQAVVTEDGKA